MKCHILVGSPKEIVSFTIMRIFNIEKISMCVIDDADVVYTTNLMKDQVIKRLKTSCRKLMITFSSGYHQLVRAPYALFDDKDFDIQVNIDHYYSKCEVHTKFHIVEAVYAVLIEHHAQSIIFCSVN